MPSPRPALVLSVVVTAGALAIAAGFALRAPLERAYALRDVRAATSLALDAASLEREGSGYVARELVVRTRGGAFFASAPLARVTPAGGALPLTLELERPLFVLSPERYRGDEMRALRGVRIKVANGELFFTRGDVPVPQLHFGAVNGTFAAPNARDAQYDVALDLLAGGRAYPIRGATQARADGTLAGAWHAALLPVAAFAPLIPPLAPFRPLGGWLRDLDVELGAAPQAAAAFGDVSATLGEHALAVHGPLVARAHAIGSRGLAGTLDGVPFSVAGEVHDLPEAPLAWAGGSRDLGLLAALLDGIATTPRLRSVRLEATAPGLGFGQFAFATERGPVAVSIVAIDPREPTLHFDTAVAEDHIVSGGARTSALGLRTGAIAGVNGDYFDIGRTYQPQGMLLRSGVLERGPTDRAALVIDRSNHVTYAEFRLRGEVRAAHATLPISELNDWPPGNVAVITPAFGKTLPAAPGRTFVALEPLPAGGSRYRVTAVAPMTQPRPVRFGFAVGPLVRTPLPAVGEIVSLHYALEPPVPDALAGIGGGPILLRHGAWYEDPHAPAPDERNVRWPVVALATRRDGTLLMVALDGRHPERSIGATRPEFAALLQRLGAVDAMALDSGGSVTLVSRAVGDATPSVRNVPSDFSAERWVSDALFLYSSAAPATLVPAAAAPTPVPEARPTP